MIRTFRRSALLFFGLSLASGWVGSTARAQTAPAGELRIGPASLTLSGRVQTQFNTTSVDGEAATQWMLRRARVEVQVQASEIVGGKLQPDFSGDRFTLKDAYMSLRLSPALQVLAGQAHRPFGILTRFSSLRMPPIEKGAEIRGTRAWDEVNLVKDLGYANRDVGLHLSGSPTGAPLGLEYEMAVVQGPDAGEITDDATAQLVARLAASPVEWLTVGGSWSRRAFVQPLPSSTPVPSRAGDAVALDLAITPSAPGLLLLAEVVSGDFDPWTGATFRGANVWVAYDLVPARGPVSMVEPLLRVSRGVLLDAPGAAGGTLVTPGINLYLGGLNRVMVNYDLWSPSGDRATEGSVKAMFQLAF